MGEAGEARDIFRCSNYSASFPLRPRNQAPRYREFPAFSHCPSKSHPAQRWWNVHFSRLSRMPIFSITTPTPQKNKISSNPPGMIENFRLKEKLNAVSSPWGTQFLTDRNDHQSSMEMHLYSRYVSGYENLQRHIKIFDPHSGTFLPLFWRADYF